MNDVISDEVAMQMKMTVDDMKANSRMDKHHTKRLRHASGRYQTLALTRRLAAFVPKMLTSASVLSIAHIRAIAFFTNNTSSWAQRRICSWQRDSSLRERWRAIWSCIAFIGNPRRIAARIFAFATFTFSSVDYLNE